MDWFWWKWNDFDKNEIILVKMKKKCDENAMIWRKCNECNDNEMILRTMEWF